MNTKPTTKTSKIRQRLSTKSYYILLCLLGISFNSTAQVVSGAILTESGSPIEGVTVNMTGDQTMNTLTDANGLYSFPSINAGDNVVVTPDFMPNNCQDACINVLDLVHTRRMILNIDPSFPSPFGGVNADINGSRVGNIDTNNPLNGISTFDLALINKQILGIEEFADCWRFVDASFIFPNTNDVNVSEIVFNNIQNNEVANFTGLRTGDVNACMDNTGSNFLGLQLQNTSTISCNALAATLDIPLTVTNFNAVMGLQFSLSWNPTILQFDGISNFNSNINLTAGHLNTQNTNTGELNFAWYNDMVSGVSLNDGEALFSLQFSVIDAQSTPISFSDINTRQLVVNDQLETSHPITTDGGLTVNTVACDHVISGVIVKTGNGAPIGGVTVNMTGDQTMSTQTDADGNYSFSAIPAGSSVVIRPELASNNCQDACINVLDNILISNHILNINQLSNPMGMIAADVNNSGTITGFDLVQQRQLILNATQQFPNSPCWRFAAPNTTDFNNVFEQTAIDNIQDNGIADFTAVQMGDVDGCIMNTETDFLNLEIGTLTTNSCNALATSGGIPITVSNFNDVMGLQFSVNWDPTILQFQGINASNMITGGDFNSSNTANGEFNFAWIDPNLSGVSLPDGATLFDLNFTVIDDQTSTISFSDVNTHQLVVSNQLNSSMPITTNGGLVIDTIECDTVSLFISDATANCGEQVCVDVTTADFQDVFSFQFSMNWDPNILEYATVGQFGVSGLGSSSFLQNTPGELGVAWADPSALGVTIPDGSSLFQICFSAKDVNNATGDVIFSNSPTFTEFVNNENILINNLNNGQITVNCPSCMSAFSYNVEDCNSVQFTNQSLGNNLTYAWNFGDGNSSTDEHPLHNYTNNGTYTAQLITSDNLGCKDTTETGIVINVNNQLNLVCNDNVAVTINSGQKLAITSQLILESFPSPDCAVDTIIFSPDTLDCTNVGANNVTATLTDINGAASSCTTVVTVTGSCDSVSFAVSDIIGNCGEQVCVNVTTANFQDILSFQFSLNWDASIVQLTSFGQFGITDLTTGNFQQTTPGEIGVSWFHNSTIGVSVPDGTSLFQLCFEAHEVNNATSNLVFSNSPSPIEMVNNNGEVAHKLTDGQIAIDCPFTFTCPPDVTINQSILPAVTGEPTFDNPALIDTFFYTDVLSEVCEPVIYERTWTMTDVNGNTSTCVQILTRATVDINDIILPPGITVDYCSGDAQAIGLEHTGTPTIYDAQLSTNEYVLGFILAFDDNMTSPTQITRSFKVVYWCDPNPAPVDIGQQIITKDTTNCSCIAAFNYDIEDVCGTVQFMNQSTQANSNPLIHSWNFGDGTTSTDEHPQHIYTTDGTYTVQLITRDNLGCADTTDTQITITIDNQGPQVICSDNLTVSINADEVLAITHQLILESFPTDVCGIDTIIFNPDSLDCTNAGNNDIIATVTDNNGNVSSCTAIVTLQVGPDANAQFFPPTPLFVYESGYDISQNVSPLGGTFSGAGINGVIFEPASAGVGIHAITYTYNNNKNCPISITADIEVLSSNLTLCDSTHISDSNARGHRDSCCHTIILGNQLANRFTSVKISTLNSTTFWPPVVTPTFLGGTLIEKSSTPNSIELIAPTQNTGICTSGNLDYLPVFGNRDIFDLCLKNATHSTNPILIEWLDCDNVICQDTINLTCPECPVINDTLVCRDDSLKYQFQIVNNFYHNIDTIKLHYIEPAGATISPNPLVLANPILSGTTSPMLEVHLDNVGNASNIKMLLEFNEIDCCFCIPDTIDLAIPVCNNYCTDSLMFCQKVDQGWMINTNDLTVDITAPLFDTSHWIVASPDWGDNANSSNCTDNVFFEIGIDGISQKDSLKCCSAGNNRFEDDNTTDGILYLDTAPRNDIYTICPTNDRYNLTATLTSFDIAQGDVLMVFDGMDVNAPFLASGSGVGVSNFNNGFVFSNPSLAVNPSGCLTFQFQTNGDNMKGSGWEMSLICEERAQPLNQTWTHTYDNSGTYIICAEVFEGNLNTLDVCWSKQMCDTITVGGCQPYFICPDDLIVADCPSTFDPNTLPAPTLVDTCGNSMPTMISSIETLITNDCSVKHIITWELLDNGNLVDICRYLVEVKDTIKPSIICPNNINLSVDLNCQVALPDLTTQSTITDNCSPIDSLIITQNPSAGAMLMPGIHDVSIIVEDECGNIDSCILQVNVEDNIAPTAICRDPINLSLSSSGFIVITAANVNDGSFDNCGIDTMYLDKYTFNCSDIGTSPTVTLTVVDIYGNSNTCISQVNIEIKIPNTFQCPSDTCLTAPIGVDSLQVNFPFPTFTGVCSNRFISCDYQSGDFFQCGTTTVTCMAIDTMSMDTMTCSFNVIVKKTDTLSIICPPDITIDCNTSIADTAITGSPIVIAACNPIILLNYQDDTLLNNACPLVIERSWKIEDSGGNEASCIQRISMVDTLPPIIVCVPDITVSGELDPSGNCNAFVDNLNMQGGHCRSFTFVNDYNNTGDASDIYPEGTTIITWTATDICGNVAQCTTKVTVLGCDGIPPTTTDSLCGQAVITCFPGYNNQWNPLSGINTTNPVLGIVDIRNRTSLTAPQYWAAQSGGNIYKSNNWNYTNLGLVFGLAIDNDNNIYTTATTAFGCRTPVFDPAGPAGDAGVYKIAPSDNITNFVTTTTSAFVSGSTQLPNTGSGLGNICYDPAHNQLFLTNFQDGMIYRIELTGNTIVDRFDPFSTTNTPSIDNPDFVKLDERSWGIAYNAAENRLYFSRWREDKGRPFTDRKNEIWSIELTASGGFQSTNSASATFFGGDVMEFEIPDHIDFQEGAQGYSNPVSDIAFGECGRMLISERSMLDDCGSGDPQDWTTNAHNARVIEYEGATLFWNLTPGHAIPPFTDYSTDLKFTISNYGNLSNSAGGIDYGYDSYTFPSSPLIPDDFIWATADFMGFQSFSAYGIQGTPATGGGINNSFGIDFDGIPGTDDKTQQGDVEIFKCLGCSSTSIDCNSLAAVVGTALSNASDSDCCYAIDFQNNAGNAITKICVDINTPHWGFNTGSLILNGAYTWETNTSTTICFEHPGGIPTGSLSNILEFCLSDTDPLASDPQEIIFSWFEGDHRIVCRDTLFTECFEDTTEKPCLSIDNLSADCTIDNDLAYCVTFDVVNNSGFTTEKITLENLSPGFAYGDCGCGGTPTGIGGNDFTFDLSTSPLLDGASTSLCVKIIAQNPVLNPKTVCFNGALSNSNDFCSSSNDFCVLLESCCSPCSSIITSAQNIMTQGDNCCYSIDVNNDCDYSFFTKIEFDLLTIGVDFDAITLNNPAWSLCNPSTPDNICISPIIPPIQPGSYTDLLRFCFKDIDASSEVPQQVQVKYWAPDANGNDSLACDTLLTFNCPIESVISCCTDSLLFCQKFDAGFMTSIDSCGVTILPSALDSCHQIIYTFGDQSPPTSSVDGNTSVGHAYASPGNYTICATVEEIGDDGMACWTKDTCWTVCVDCDTCTTPELYNVAACYAGNTINFSGYDQQMDIEYHPSGQYYYTTGSIIGNSYCNYPVTAYGGLDVVISKIDNTTDNVIQAFTFDGTGDDIGRVIKYVNGHIYVAGAFTSDTLRIPSPGDNELSAKTLQSTGAVHTTFLTKYDANFKLIWAFSLNGIRTTIEDIAIGNTNEVAITGLFQGANVDFNPLNTAAPFTISSGSNHSGYVAKYTPNGNLLWANSYTVTTVPTPISVSSAGYGVGIDQQNNTYVTGEFTGNLTISTNNNNNPISTTYSDTVARAFLIQINNIGNTTWHTDIKSTPGNATSGWDIAIDNNDMYVAGWSGFIAKYDISQALPVQQWYYDVGYDIYEIAITNQQLQTFGTQKRRPRGPANPDRGIVGYNFDFKNDAVPIPSRGGWDMVLAYYDLEGNFLKGINVGGGLFEIGHGIAAHNGETVIIGHFDSSNLEYDPKNSNNTFTLSATPPTTDRGTFIGKYACKCPIEIECPQDISIDVPVGTDSIQVNFDPPTMSGFCDRIITCDYQSGDFFPCDTTLVTCMAIDTLVNDTAFCSFKVIVNKVDTCAIRCPSDIVITAAPNSSGVVVNFNPPTLSSGCDPSYTVSCSRNSGDVFSCGTTTVTCTVSDGNGNPVETCTFTITINCSCQPIIRCPDDAIVDCCNDFNFLPPNLINPSCGNAKVLICKRDDGLSLTAPYPSGVTAITCIADNDLGWIDSCTYFVTVLDTIPPMLDCPIDTVVTVMDSCQYILPDFRPIVSVSDSCDPTAGIIVIQQPSPGVILTPGFHPITIIASDSCGNEDSCVIDLTVICKQDSCCKDSIALDALITSVFNNATVNCDTLCLKPIPDTCNLHWMVDWGNDNNTPWDGVTDSICQVYNATTPTDFSVCITVFELNDDGSTCRTQTICDTFLIENCEPNTFCGKAVITCFPSFNNNSPTQGINPNDAVLGIVDIRDRSSQSPGQYWSSASGTNIYHANTWNYQNLGLVFGLALDNQNNIYTSSTTLYGCTSPSFDPFGPTGEARIYRIDPSDNITILVNEGPFDNTGNGNTIPSNGAGFGNICYDEDHNQLFATNLHDGYIYRIDLNTGTGIGTVVERFDPFTTINLISNDNTDFVALGERPWGIGYYENRLYFSRWVEDRQRISTTENNQIWSVAINSSTGAFATGCTSNTCSGGDVMEITLPDHTHDVTTGGGLTNFMNYSNPVSDIAFSAEGLMLIAEKTMGADCGAINQFGALNYNLAHNARVLEYEFTTSWNLTPGHGSTPFTNYGADLKYRLGTSAVEGQNAAGGIDYGYSNFDATNLNNPPICDAMIWATGDALYCSPFSRIYGMLGIPSTGGGNCQGYQIDYDGFTSGDNARDKWLQGDVEVFKCFDCPKDESDCDSLMVMVNPISMPEDSICCYTIDLKNNVSTDVTKVCFDLFDSPDWIMNISTINIPGFTWSVATGNQICLENSAGIPLGMNVGVMDFCLAALEETARDTQCLAVSWFKGKEQIACTDTLKTFCEFEPDGEPCFIISNVSIDCTDGDDNSYCMNFDVTNITSFDASGIILNSLPSGYLFDDCGCGGSPFGLGDYAFDFGISTPLMPNQTRSLCIKLISIQPVLSPTDVCFFGALQSFTECCKSPNDICVTLNPCCSPCESMQVNVDELEKDCCYAIDVDYSCDYTVFNKITFDITSTAIFGTHTINDANWTTCLIPAPQSVCIEPITPGGIPAGLYDDLFEFCLSNTQSNTTETMKITYWMLDQNGQDSMACDTLLEFVCDTIIQPCVFITDEEIICIPDSGKYQINLTVQNISTDGLVADGILIQPFSTEISPNPINFTSPLLNDGSTATISFCYEPVNFPDSDDELVLVYKLFQGNYHNCCNGNETILDTLMLPPCDTTMCIPIVICPSDTCINLIAGETGIIVDYPLPVDTNNCEVEITCDPPAGTFFQCGTTPVVCTIIDLQTGNRSFCEFNVIVKCDTTNCEVDLICPMDEVVSCCDDYSFVEPSLTDTCGNARIISCTRDDGLPLSGALGTGTTCFTCIAGNDFGWLDTCKYTVTVLDTIPPFINCPNDTLINLIANCNYTLPDVTGWASIADDCNFTVIQNPIAGTIFPDGTHPIQIIATDDCGNINSCTFDLIIRCDTMPMIGCCKDSLIFCELAESVFNSYSLNCDTLCFEPVLDNCDLDWSIDWGDGNSGPWNPNQPNICHDYNLTAADNYMVCLKVNERNPDGTVCQQKIICDTIFIAPCPPIIMDGCCKDTADFNKRIANLTITPVYNNCEISVNATGLDTCDVIYWNWGDMNRDGPLGNNSSISHTYNPTGPYTVCYTVAQMNSLGDTCFSKTFCLPQQVECEDPSCDSIPIIKTFSTTILTDVISNKNAYQDQGLSGIDLLDGNIRLVGHSWAYGPTANEMIPELSNAGTLIENHIKDNQLIRNHNEYPQDIYAYQRKGIANRNQGLAITGYVKSSDSRTTDLLLQTLRPDGSIIQTVHHGQNTTNERGNALISDRQNRLVIAGQFNNQAHAVKFNSNLSQVWGKTIAFAGEQATLLNVIEITPSACLSGVAPFYAFVGYKANRSNKEGLVVILDANGNYAYPVQSFTLGGGVVEGMAIAQNSQGALVITGRHTTPYPDNRKRIFVLNMDCVNASNYQINWSNLYDIPPNIGEFAKSILIDRADNIILNGTGYLSDGGIRSFSGKKGSAIMLSISSNGQTVNWAHKYFDTRYNGTEFNHLSQTIDGGYLSTGSAWRNQSVSTGGVGIRSLRFQSPVHEFYAVKTDQEGVVSDCDCYEPIEVIPLNVRNGLTNLTNPAKDFINPLFKDYNELSGPFDQQFCEQYCPTEACECGEFLDMGFYSDIESQFAPSFGLACETGYVLPCNVNEQIAGIKAYFECKGSCSSSKRHTWTLTNTSKGQVVESGSFALPNINIEFSPTAFSENGVYVFEMKAYCGDEECTCSMAFLVDDCPGFCADNSLINGEFTDGLVAGLMPLPGNVNNWGAIDGPIAIDNDGCTADGCIELTGTQIRRASIYQSQNFTLGSTYELTFCAKTLNPNLLSNQIEVRGIGFFAFSQIGFTPDLTDTWQTYSFTFQPTLGDLGIAFSAWVTDPLQKAGIRIDDICLTKVTPDDCNCNDLASDITGGFDVQYNCNQVTFTPNDLTNCDQLSINWGDGSTTTSAFGNQSTTHAYNADGTYNISVKITRVEADGTTCTRGATELIVVRCFSDVETFVSSNTIATPRNNNATCGGGFIANGFFENGAFPGNLNLAGTIDDWQVASGNPVVDRDGFFGDFQILLNATNTEQDAIFQEVIFTPANSYTFSAVIESCDQMTGENAGVCEGATIEVFASLDPLETLDCTDNCTLIGTYTIAETNDTMEVELAAWTPDQTYNFLTIAVKSTNEATQLTSLRLDDICIDVQEVLSSCCQDSLSFVRKVEAGFEFSILDCSIEAKGRQLDDCQQVFWKFGADSPLTDPVAGNTAIRHQFLSSDNYEVCMFVAEIGTDGTTCFEAIYCETIPITACVTDTVCCVNTPEFGTILDNGFTLINENQCEISVSPNILPGDCYQITWNWGDDSPQQTVTALDSFALSHVYPSTNSNELYEVCMSLELLENGDTCLVDEYCEFVEINCNNIPVDSCSCLGFDNLSFSTPNQSWAFNCGDKDLLLDCEAATINFGGTFACSAACQDKVLFWEAFGASGDFFSGFIQLNAQNEFNLPFSEMGFVKSESYTLILNGNCDGNSCESCQVQFAIPMCSDTCCVETTVFESQVAQGFSTEKTCESLSVQPIGLDACDIITWQWGDGATAQSIADNQVSHNYNIDIVTKLAVEVCMQVTRLDDTGNPCLTSEHCQMVTIDNCCSCDDFNFDFELSKDCSQILVTPTGVYDDCDEIKWKWGDDSEIVSTLGTATATHNYTMEGPYVLEMTVFRSAAGQSCGRTTSQNIAIECLSTGLADLSANKQIRIYPNPVNHLLQIEINEPLKIGTEIRVLNLMGQLIHTQRIATPNLKHEVSLSNYVPGVYLIEIQEDTYIYRHKIIKQ